MVINDTASGYINDAGTLLDFAKSIIIEHTLQLTSACYQLLEMHIAANDQQNLLLPKERAQGMASRLVAG